MSFLYEHKRRRSYTFSRAQLARATDGETRKNLPRKTFLIADNDAFKATITIMHDLHFTYLQKYTFRRPPFISPGDFPPGRISLPSPKIYQIFAVATPAFFAPRNFHFQHCQPAHIRSLRRLCLSAESGKASFAENLRRFCHCGSPWRFLETIVLWLYKFWMNSVLKDYFIYKYQKSF